jgi:hypothetical protein
MANKPASAPGDKHGLLTIVRVLPGRMVECECECGGTITCAGFSVRQGRTKSCGCLNHRSETASRAAMNIPEEQRKLRAQRAIATRWARVAAAKLAEQPAEQNEQNESKDCKE